MLENKQANQSSGHKKADNSTDQESLQEDVSAEGNVLETPSSDPEGENQASIKINEELVSQKDKYLRLFAEFDNFKRRSARENIELRQTAGKEIIISLLDVLDDCDRAERQFQKSEDPDQIKEGVRLVFNKLRNTLQAKGLKPFESLHTNFDIEKHEAIAEVPVDDIDMRGKVVDEIDRGYFLNDKLIRFAKVVVGK